MISSSTPVDSFEFVTEEILNDVIPTLRMIQAAKGRVGQIIFASSGGCVYGEMTCNNLSINSPLTPINTYGAMKISLENYFKLASRYLGIKIKIARISNPYGIGGSKCKRGENNLVQGLIPLLIRKIINQENVTIYGNTVRDYIYIDDLVRALIQLGNYDGDVEIFNIGTGIGTDLKSVVRCVEAISKLSFPIVEYLPKRLSDVQQNVLDIEETKKLLNWEPKVTLPQGIRNIFSRMSE